MTDIERQIALARKKPVTAESLNHIGDLLLKDGDTAGAMAYFFEAADKQHFAHKEKKLAIYKKIIKISPTADRAYEGIIDILSGMGLVMEKKKYLIMLAQLYRNRGESANAQRLFSEIRDLYSHKQVQDAAQATEEAIEENTKLIEASIDEVRADDLRDNAVSKGMGTFIRFSRGIAFAVAAVIVLAAAFYYFYKGRIQSGGHYPVRPVSVISGDFEIFVSGVDVPEGPEGLSTVRVIDSEAFMEVAVRSLRGCIPAAFASAPHDMIKLQGPKGAFAETIKMEGLRKTIRVISKMNICDEETGAIFVRVIIAYSSRNNYSGLAINGLQQGGGPVLVSWDPR
jgi:tetratricopeptide (TPR) repeat protein